MTPQEQRIAIALVCGWRDIHIVEADGIQRIMGGHPDNVLGNQVFDIPDYVNRLDAMHQAEMTILPHERGQYICWLVEVIGQQEWSEISVWYEDAFYPVIATAAQRAEAFLKTVGKWEDYNP